MSRVTNRAEMPDQLQQCIVYIPMDRRRALAHNTPLPDRVDGAAIFTDIDGFTKLTDRLVDELGPQLGAEALATYLDQVYDSVINVLHSYGASAIAFAGDSVTSWVEGDDGRTATACALAIREAMSPYAAIRTQAGSLISLSVKTVVAAGPARRFLVGDPQIRLIDALTGSTLERLGAAGELMKSGEVLVEGETAARIVDAIDVVEWRKGDEAVPPCAVVGALTHIPSPPVLQPSELDALSAAAVLPWLHREIFQWLQSGRGKLIIAARRPTVALFLRFEGIDYDEDVDAGAKLDMYVSQVQQVVEHYRGSLLDLNFGDKGSYIYINFGALIAHEDDAERALSAALDLRETSAALEFIKPVQIGISSGQMRVGAYGGTAHQTYGALGAEVNMAARLMMRAEAGQILVSKHTIQSGGERFIYEELPAIQVKGRTRPVPICSLIEPRTYSGFAHPSALATEPLVGRSEELSCIEQRLNDVVSGSGRIIGVHGEAGLGKSRLIAEALKEAGRNNLAIYVSECESYGLNTNYLVWQPIWRALLGIDGRWTVARQIDAARQSLTELDPQFADRYPLLGTLLNIEIPDNELTAALDGELHKSMLESLLVDCLNALASRQPRVLVLEDCHWLDPLSQDLLATVAEGVQSMPVVILLSFRRPEAERLRQMLVSDRANFERLDLQPLTQEEAETHIHLLLSQLYDRHQAIAPALLHAIIDKAEGNPYYIVELLNNIHEQSLDPAEEETLTLLELPDRLHSLVLSRIDRLPEQQVSVLKTASVAGRLFHRDWLGQAYQSLGTRAEVHTCLDELTQQSILALNAEDPRATHLFRQSIVQEALYESIPHALRTELHEAVGAVIEVQHADSQETILDLLAFHFDHSQNREKKVEYLRRAGAAAQKKFANEAAIEYYHKVIPLLSAPEIIDVSLNLGQVLQLVGRWDEARRQYDLALHAAEDLKRCTDEARACRALGQLLYHEQPREALAWLDRGRALAAQGGTLSTGENEDVAVSEAAFLVDIGWARMQLGETDAAVQALRSGLDGLPETPGNIRGNALSSLCGIYFRQGDVQNALHFAELALQNARAMPDLWQEQIALSSLASAHYIAMDLQEAVEKFAQAASVAERIGDKRVQAGLEVNLGVQHLLLGDAELAQHHLERGIRLTTASRLLEYEFLAQLTLAQLHVRTGTFVAAQAPLARAADLADTLDDPARVVRTMRTRAEVALGMEKHAVAGAHAQAALALAEARQLDLDAAISKRVLGQTLLAVGDVDTAKRSLEESYSVLCERDQYEAARAQFQLGRALSLLGDEGQSRHHIAAAYDVFESLGAGFDLAAIERPSKLELAE